MQMLGGSRRLIYEWEAGGMENHGCEGGAEAGFHRYNYLGSLQQTETRLRRMAQFVAATLLLLTVGVLVLLITVGLERKARAGYQTNVEPNSSSSDKSGNKQQLEPSTGVHENSNTASAMLTVPVGNVTDGKYLLWESEIGLAHCQGGFVYSKGSLVVPRKGTYRVFLQVTYEGGGEACLGPVMKLTNTVFSISNKYSQDRKLLSSAETVKCSKEPWIKSLYTSAPFLLDANDILHVTSSHPNLIVKHEDQVFFGAELLSE